MNCKRLGHLDATNAHAALSPRAWVIPCGGRVYSPGKADGQTVDLGNDSGRNSRVVRSVPIDPVGRSSIPLDIEGLDEICLNMPALHEVFHLGPSHRVALDRGRVMDVVDPDGPKDVVRLDRSGKPSQVLMKKADLFVETSEHVGDGGAPWTVFPTEALHGTSIVEKKTLPLANTRVIHRSGPVQILKGGKRKRRPDAPRSARRGEQPRLCARVSTGQSKSRRSDSNRRPTDYKSVALARLRHAGRGRVYPRRNASRFVARAQSTNA